MITDKSHDEAKTDRPALFVGGCFDTPHHNVKINFSNTLKPKKRNQWNQGKIIQLKK